MNDLGASEPQGRACLDCGHTGWETAKICPKCLGSALKPVALGTEATLYSYTIMHAGSIDEPLVYGLGYVDFPAGVRALVRLDPPYERYAPDEVVSVQRAPAGLMAKTPAP